MDGGLQHCTRGSNWNHPNEKEMQKAKLFSEEALQVVEERKKWNSREKAKDIPNWMQSCRNSKKRQEVLQFSSLHPLSNVSCDPMNRSTAGLPVHHQLLESTQTHVHWVGDAIQPSHHLSSPSPLSIFQSPPSQSFSASGAIQMSQLFTSGGQSIGISASTSVLPKNIQDWSTLGWTGWISLYSKGFSRIFSNTTV